MDNLNLQIKAMNDSKNWKIIISPTNLFNLSQIQAITQSNESSKWFE